MQPRKEHKRRCVHESDRIKSQAKLERANTTSSREARPVRSVLMTSTYAAPDWSGAVPFAPATFRSGTSFLYGQAAKMQC